MTLQGPVLVGTDLSDRSDEALRQGAELARYFDSPLIVCHVMPELIPDGSFFTEFRRANLQIEESVLARARAAVQAQLDRVLEFAGSPPDIVLESGTPRARLIANAEATHAGLVVTGPGWAAAEVARHVPSASLIARKSPRGPVVAATDFSEASQAAIEVAVAEARRRGSPLHLLHAFDVGLFSLGEAPDAAMPYLAGRSPIALEGLDELRVIAKQRLDDALREAGVDGQTDVISGTATEGIVRQAETVRAELVVLGTHGRTGFDRLTLGSVAAGVIDSAPCSVLVVRASR